MIENVFNEEVKVGRLYHPYIWMFEKDSDCHVADWLSTKKCKQIFKSQPFKPNAVIWMAGDDIDRQYEFIRKQERVQRLEELISLKEKAEARRKVFLSEQLNQTNYQMLQISTGNIMYTCSGSSDFTTPVAPTFESSDTMWIEDADFEG